MGRGWRSCAPATAGTAPSGIVAGAAAAGSASARPTGCMAGGAPPAQQGPQHPGQPQQPAGMPDRAGALCRPDALPARPMAPMSIAGARGTAACMRSAIAVEPPACASMAMQQQGRPIAVDANVAARSAAAPRITARRARERARKAARTIADDVWRLRCVTVRRQSRRIASDFEPGCGGGPHGTEQAGGPEHHRGASTPARTRPPRGVTA